MSSQSGQKVLRVGLIQNGRILEERLMRQLKPVTIGSSLKKNTLIVPASDLPKSFTLFDIQDGRYVLQFAKNMTGRLYLGDSVQSLEDLVKRGKAKKSAAGYSVALTPNARGKVVLGEVTVLFQFVTAPPPRPVPVLPASMRGGLFKGIDPIALGLMAVSAFIQIGFVTWVQMKDWPEPSALEYQLPDRFARVMLEREEEKKKIEIEESEKKEESEQPSPVAEAPPTPTPTEEKPVEEAPSDKTPEEIAQEERRQEIREDIERSTLLGAIGTKGEGGIMDSLFEGAGAVDIADAFEGSVGVKHAAAGEEKTGLGRRAGGDAEVGARAGIEDLGRTKGAAKAEKGVKTGKMQERQVKARPIRIRDPEEMMGTGVVDGQSISQAIRRRQGAIQQCYERELRRNPSAGGRVVINITITARGSRGTVSQAKAAVDDVGGGVGECVAGELRNLRGLPAPEGGDVITNIPFVFQPAN